MTVQDLLERVDGKLDKIGDRLNGVDVTLTRQEGHLTEHMRRTALLENRVEPLEKAQAAWGGVAKAVTIAAAVIGVLSGHIVGRILGH